MTLAIGIISLDNYDDVVDKMDDKNIAYLSTFVTTMVADWANEYQIFYKRINSERYIFVADMTASMGIAYGHDTTEKIGEQAQSNLDMALARGGDQVVLKDTDPQAKPQFYGGTTDGTIKRTRTRSRAMSMALKRIFKENPKVFIMGHRFPDMDSIGAAFGVATLARFNHNECYVILDRKEITRDIERCLAVLDQSPELAPLIVSSEEALTNLDENSVLVLVDHHRPSLAISQEVYEAFDKVVIIDHHRRGDEFPQNPLLSYIETSASSASELVAELVEYQSDKTHQLSKLVATMLLAGIYVDTKSFSVRTTGRTFDLASYLKNHGADLSIIQDFLASDLWSYLQISELVSRCEYVTPEIVVAVGPEDRSYDNVTVAKTADTLLSMNDIMASFVITKRTDGLVGISARSAGKINVQKLMENLGGGGHFTNAAAQIDQPLEKVQEMLFNELRR